MVARASASMVRGARTLTDAVCSTGHPVRGSITWPYQASATWKPRLARPEVARASLAILTRQRAGRLS